MIAKHPFMDRSMPHMGVLGRTFSVCTSGRRFSESFEMHVHASLCRIPGRGLSEIALVTPIGSPFEWQQVSRAISGGPFTPRSDH
jgi:hypothetical protein